LIENISDEVQDGDRRGAVEAKPEVFQRQK
jgi:hypothetical protein